MSFASGEPPRANATRRRRWLQLWGGANPVRSIVLDVLQGRGLMPETMTARLSEDIGEVVLTIASPDDADHTDD